MDQNQSLYSNIDTIDRKSQVRSDSQPDQNNSTSKIKYYSNNRVFEQPIFRYFQNDINTSNSIIYGANSTLTTNQNMNTNTQYTRGTSVPVDQAQTIQQINPDNFDNKFFPSLVRDTVGNPQDYSNKIKIDNEFTRPGYNKSNQIPEFKSNDNRTFKLVNDRRRNLDHSEYINIGSMTNTGFGNISDFSKIKYGTSTRDIDGTYRDRELDRFHFTYRNFQHELYGSNAIPQDTRYLNKKF